MQTGRLGLFIVPLMAGCLALNFCAAKPDAAKSPAAAEQTSAAAPTPATGPGAASGDATSPSGSEPQLSPEQATGAVKGIPAATNTAPITAVANYFTDLPGIDLAALQPRQREKLLQRANSELCTCGCKNDTLARCYVNDPRCPVVKGMVQKVYDEVKSGR